MSCWHGWHGCGPWYGPSYGGPGYGPVDWYEEAEWPVRRRRRGYGRREAGAATDELEARLAELRDELRRVESELAGMRGTGDAAAEGE